MATPDGGEPPAEKEASSTRTADRQHRLAMTGAAVLLVVGVGLIGAALVASGDDGDAGGKDIDLSADPAGGTEPEGSAGDGTTGPTTPANGLGEGFSAERQGRSPLRGFGEAVVTVTGDDGAQCELCMLLANTAEQRARGLMEVTDPDLGGYDGMVFEYPSPVDGAFFMRNTPLPLSIAYFDAQGAFVSTTDMTPCDDVSTCPTYPAGDVFQFAVEVPEGELRGVQIGPGSTIELGAGTCSAADD